MPAPKGNKYWEFRNKHGRDFKYKPEDLWKEAIAYFEHISNSAWNKKEPIKAGKLAGTLVDIPTQTPMSIQSFCIFADIDDNTFIRYEKEEGYEDFWEITGLIKSIIETNQFEGATVGAYNANIIARKLGMSDKHLHGSDPENPIPPTSIPLVLSNGKTYEDLKNELKPE